MSLTLFGLTRIAARTTAKTSAYFKTISGFLSIVVLVAAASPLAVAGTYAVGNCTAHAFYNTIQQAVTSVPAGSTIQICPGNYLEQVVIGKNLTLTGVSSNGFSGVNASGANNPVILPPLGGVVVNASDIGGGDPIAAQIAVITPPSATAPIVVSINNLTIDGSGSQATCGTDIVGIYYQNANGTINHVVARFQQLIPADFGCQDGQAIFAQGGYSSSIASSVTIENNSVHDYDKNGITVDGDGVTATVSGNYVVGIGPTPLTAQNGIQISDGAMGKVTSNTVTDDVYINPSNCTASGPTFCFSASGILLFNSGGTSASPITISSNTVSNTQGAIVAFAAGGTADWNAVTSNKITTSPSAGVFQIDGIDLCSNNNTAKSNTVFNSSGSGVHIDSSCTTETSGSSGNGTAVSGNTISEACAGVLLGSGTGNSASSNTTYNVVATTTAGDSCPNGESAARRIRTRPQPHK